MSRTSLFSFERDEPPAWTVGELTAKVKATLERGFADVAVKGEISGLSRRDRGHVYFNLKDDAACLRGPLEKRRRARRL